MRKLVAILVFVALSSGSIGQELNCQVKVILGQNVQTASVDRTVFTSMETTIREFMNNTRWTDDIYKIEERIECSILITINEAISSSKFSGSIQVTSRRPVYNSNYNSTILNYNDQDFIFEFLRNTRLQFSIDQHRNNLTSILAFYAYMVLGYDYDSFSLEGGTRWFNKAQQIVSNAQNAPERGWKQFDGQKNRYWLVDNALHNVFKPLRKCFYEYHRKGFDNMYEDVNKGRAAVTQALERLQQVQKNRPLSLNVQIFFAAKTQEIINLYSEAFPQEQTKVKQILQKVDPMNSDEYEKIGKN